MAKKNLTTNLIRRIKLRTWVGLGLIAILAPIGILAALNWQSILASFAGSSANPAAHWAFDEGSANTCTDGTSDACDSSGNGNDGAFGAAAPTIQTDDLCVSGKCLLFDGTNDTVTVANTVASIQTVSFWVKVMSTSTTEQILDLNATDTFSSVSGTVTVAGFGIDTIYVDGKPGTSLSASRWHHVTVTTTSGFSGSAITLGNISTNFGNIFLDEVKLFTAQLTADQVRAEFAGGAAVFSDKTAFLNDGLVGYWPLDEAVDNSCTDGVEDKCDKSGNSNDGDIVATTSVVGGKFGNAINLAGTGATDIDDSNSLDSPSNEITISLWVNRNSITNQRQLVCKCWDSDIAYNLSFEDEELQFEYEDSGNTVHNYANSQFSDPFSSTGVWYFVTLTYRFGDAGSARLYKNGESLSGSWISGTGTSAANANNNSVVIGARNGGGFGREDALFDEIRIYNRALSPAEVRALYNWAPGPVGYWKIDEGAGATTAADSSGYGFNGTITDFSNIPGKYGGALLGDESGNDNIQVSDNDVFDIPATGSFTIMGWIKINGDNQFSNPQSVVAHGSADSGAQSGFAFVVRGLATVCANAANGGTRVCLKMADGTDRYVVYTNNSLNVDQTWHHIAAVLDRSSEANTTIYIDGILQAVSRSGTFADLGDLSSEDTLYIGNINGALDEIKFYNYARTSQQIIEDMNGGHPTGGSPIGSQVGYWRFDEMNGTTANDTGLGANNGTITNSPAWSSSGKINGALDFESGSSQYVTVTSNSEIALTGSLSLSAWIKPESTTDSTEFPIATKGGRFALTQYGDEIRMYVNSASNYETTNAANLSTGTWYHIVGVYDAASSDVKIYVNGLDKATTTTGTIPSSIGAGGSSLDIGRFTYENSVEVSQSSDDARQATDDTVSITGTTMEADTTTEHIGVRFNSVSLAQAATVTSGTLTFWVTSSTQDEPDHTIRADDVDDCATFSTTSNDIDGRADTTASATWSSTDLGGPGLFTTSSISSVVQEIIDRPGWASGNDMCFVVTGSATTTRDLTVAAQDDTSLPAPVFNYSSTAFTYYDGLIDEVQLYSSALTAEQVKIVMNANSAVNFGSTANSEASQLAGGAGNPPVGWWSLDDNSGTSAQDKSGGGSTGTLTGGPTWANGKYGPGVSFDGGNDLITINNDVITETAAYSVIFWVYPRTLTNDDTFFDTNGGTGGGEIYYSGGAIRWCNTSSCAGEAASNTGVLTTNAWNHVTTVYDGAGTATFYVNGVNQTSDSTLSEDSNQTIPPYVGNNAGTALAVDGIIDEVKVYDYARTTAQIAYDFNRGGPVGWWRFNECSGTTANDASGNGQNGTINIGATGANTSAGTCTSGNTAHAWYDGRTGKFNSGLDFDTDDDYVSFTDSDLHTFGFSNVDRPFSISAWVWYDGTAEDFADIVYKGTSGSREYGLAISDDILRFEMVEGGSFDDIGAYMGTVAFPNNQWVHVAGTYDGSENQSGVNLYMNGINRTITRFQTGTYIGMSNSTGGLTINAFYGGTGGFASRLDDIRIYNYELSATQVKKLYNDNSGARFGPSSGSP